MPITLYIPQETIAEIIFLLISANPKLKMYWQGLKSTKTITQEFTTDGAIHQSCLSSSEEKVLIVDPIRITKKVDPLTRNVGDRYLFYEDEDWTYSLENRDCYLSDGTK